MNAIDFWAGMWRSGMALAETNVKVAETLGAAHHVVSSRSQTIAAASHSPLEADLVELGRMVPEKIDAFSRGALAGMTELQSAQSQIFANWQAMVRMGIAGRMPTAKEAGLMTARTERTIDTLARAGGKALAPVHRTATANAKRLARKKG